MPCPLRSQGPPVRPRGAVPARQTGLHRCGQGAVRQGRGHGFERSAEGHPGLDSGNPVVDGQGQERPGFIVVGPARRRRGAYGGGGGGPRAGDAQAARCDRRRAARQPGTRRSDCHRAVGRGYAVGGGRGGRGQSKRSHGTPFAGSLTKGNIWLRSSRPLGSGRYAMPTICRLLTPFGKRADRTGEPAMIFGLAKAGPQATKTGQTPWLSENGVASPDGLSLFNLRNVEIE